MGDLCDRWIAAQSEDLFGMGIHGMDLAGEAVVEDVGQHCVANLALGPRGSDHGDGLRAVEKVEGGQGLFLGAGMRPWHRIPQSGAVLNGL